jgi:cold shock CspA family protein
MIEAGISKAQRLLAAFVADLPSCAVLGYEWDEKATLRFSLVLDGQLRVRGERDEAHRGPLGHLVDLVKCLDEVQQSVIEDGVGRAWPACPDHGHHPLRATSSGWSCACAGATRSVSAETPEDLTNRWHYGTLGKEGSLRPLLVADHVIRWYRPDWGWGIIADEDGEVWFHASSFEEPVSNRISDGASVAYEVSGRQGVLRSVARGSLRVL